LGEDAYRRSGVDLQAGHRAVDMIRSVAAGAAGPEAVGGVGGFAGLFDLGDGRLLVSATDGVGTKLEVARVAGRLDTIGIDLVAMSVNDVICAGARPLFFLDYLAVGKLVPEEAATIVAGVAEGCRRAGCALLGGETAEHPGVLDEGRFDLAGFCVGLVDERDLLGPDRVRLGDLLLGLSSSGLHSNGYSLVRRVLLEEGGWELDEVVPRLGRTLVNELLEPTAIYAQPLLALSRAGLAHSAAHITGGGWGENLPRALPDNLGARVDPSSWTPQPIFGMVADAAGLGIDALYDVLNMGIGMVVVIPPDAESRAKEVVIEAGVNPVVVGEVEPGPGVRFA
jgi:phosphoribosylformylglycinamidine cyclo-ligase